MKNLTIITLIGLLVITNMGWGVWAFRLRAGKAGSATSISNAPSYIPRPSYNNPSMVNEWQEYQATRVRVLRDRPDLAAEYKEIVSEMADQQEKLNAAMVSVDPKVGPIIAKLAMIHQHNTLPSTMAVGKPGTSTN